MGDNSYQSLYELEKIQFNTEERLTNYLNFLESSQGSIFQLVSPEDITQTCQFSPTVSQSNAFTSNRRRLSSQNCSSRYILFFVNGVLYTAAEAEKNINRIRKATK